MCVVFPRPCTCLSGPPSNRFGLSEEMRGGDYTRDACPSNMEQAKVWLDKDVDLEDALVVCCFPSVGMVSSVVAHF